VSARLHSNNNVMKLEATDHNSKREGRARRFLTLAATLLLLTSSACASDPQKEARQELQTLSSWAATIHLLGEAWLERSVPGRYAQKTLDEARQTLQDESQTIQQSSSMPADARASLVEHAQKLDKLAGTLREEVQTGDPSLTRQALDEVAQEQQTLEGLARGAGARGR
jgi:hypothetical protein